MDKDINFKLPKEKRDQLRFVVEDFFNYESEGELKSYFEKHHKELDYFYQINNAFFENYYLERFCVQEGLNRSDLSKKKLNQIKSFLLEIHVSMRGVWKYVSSLLKEYENLYQRIEQTSLKNDKTEIERLFLEAYEANKLENVIELKKEINLKPPELPKDLKYELTFAGNKITFEELAGYRPDPIIATIDFFQDVPLHYFEKCGYCDKWMIKITKGKNYCKRCVPKKYQKEKYQEMKNKKQAKVFN